MHKKIKAFTLIELLVVIAIVGILSGFIFVSMNSAITASKDAKRKADLSAIAKAISMYSAQNGGALPSTGTSCDVCNGCLGACTDLYTNISPYLTIIPTDPNGPTVYYKYTYSATLPSFTLQSILSNGLAYTYDSTSGFATVSAFISPCTGNVQATTGLACTETTDVVGGVTYVVDKFTYVAAPGSYNWSVPSNITSVEYLVVGGGGGGSDGGNYGGGGGAGQFLTASGFAISGNIIVKVGAGGGHATAGNTSIFSTITAAAGLAGSGLTGGTSGNSFAGGSGGNSNPYGGGGGGGSSAIGGNASGYIGGNGGTGTLSDISGTNIVYGGGGGGGGSSPGGAAGSGSAGGGNGSFGSGNGGNALPNTGSGGGGAVNATGGTGGSGVIIVKYIHP